MNFMRRLTDTVNHALRENLRDFTLRVDDQDDDAATTPTAPPTAVVVSRAPPRVPMEEMHALVMVSAGQRDLSPSGDVRPPR